MAQAQPDEKINENPEKDIKEAAANNDSSSFRFNAHAPEFVPRSHAQMPMSGYYYSCFQILGGGSDWFYVGDHQDPTSCWIPGSNLAPPNCSKNILTPDLQLKIIKQVEYQFSDMSLLANESFLRQTNKDPEGYVPISLVASTKKVKALVTDIHLLTQALRSSSKLILSADGKKIKRRHPFTDKEKEELQSRTVVAENLPEDHSHQNLQKIFSVVGSIKTIRICHPQESNSPRPKSDFFISNKLHALVEYETSNIAEKAVDKLNDERNWRKGMRVRQLLRRTPRSVLKSRKSDFDVILENNEFLNSESAEDSSHPNNTDLNVETNESFAKPILQKHKHNKNEENTVGLKKGWARGQGKGRGRGVQSHSGRGLLAAAPSLPSSLILCEASAKHNSKGPRMPDGTRGFTMGRGKPISPPVLATSL